jgi:hypothetical protein
VVGSEAAVNVTEAFIDGYMTAREFYGCTEDDVLHGGECQKSWRGVSCICTCDEESQRQDAALYAPRPVRRKYKFVGREGERYVWHGPRVDSRVEELTCGVAWFWGVR